MNRRKMLLLSLIAVLTISNTNGYSVKKNNTESVDISIEDTNVNELKKILIKLINDLNNENISIILESNTLNIVEYNSCEIDYDKYNYLFEILEYLYNDIVINYTPSKNSCINFNKIVTDINKYEINLKVNYDILFNDLYNNVKCFKKVNLYATNIDNVDGLTSLLNLVGNRLDYQGNLYLELNDFDTSSLFRELKSTVMFNNVYINSLDNNYLKYFYKIHAFNCFLVINRNSDITLGHIERLYLYGCSDVNVNGKVNDLYVSDTINVQYGGKINECDEKKLLF